MVGIIPARSGSKRLPNKNLADLDGRPLIVHTCQAAIDSGVLSAVYINTDSAEIASTAVDAGATCPVLRPAPLASDDATTRDATLFMLDFLANRGETYNAVMILQPTSPLRTAADIRAAWDLFHEHAPCAVVSVTEMVPESWSGRIGRDGQFEQLAGTQMLHRLNGAIYVYRWDDYVRKQIPRKTIAYRIPPERGIDIDTPDDLKLARFMIDRRKSPAQELRQEAHVVAK